MEVGMNLEKKIKNAMTTDNRGKQIYPMNVCYVLQCSHGPNFVNKRNELLAVL